MGYFFGEEEGKGGAMEVLTIEEHAKRQGSAPSILAAVMQFEGWACGKKIAEDEFKRAINAFLSSPISGLKEGSN
ncbi:MAG: hypothetical protein LBB43_02005 [Spirochaetaceae bacterium]|jgi:hypothetical protein|nr:hypothetical protein [Spirochaetaceae bacterium]